MDASLWIKSMILEDDGANGVVSLAMKDVQGYFEVSRVRMNLKACQSLRIGTPLHIMLETPEVVEMKPAEKKDEKKNKKKVPPQIKKRG